MIIKDGCFILHSKDGYLYGVSGLFSQGKYVDNSSADFLQTPLGELVAPVAGSGLPMPDFLYALPYDCFSERAYAAIIKANLTISSQVLAWLSVRAENTRGRERGRYWWPKHSSKGAYDVFDYENSKFTVHEADGKSPNDISRWVLHGDTIQSLDLFYACKVNSRWFCTPRFKSVVEENELTGFKFLPAEFSFVKDA